jgi:hypothetical protein
LLVVFLLVIDKFDFLDNTDFDLLSIFISDLLLESNSS